MNHKKDSSVPGTEIPSMFLLIKMSENEMQIAYNFLGGHKRANKV